MDLQNLTVTALQDVATVYSVAGERFTMVDRWCYGLSLCYEGRISYRQNGQSYVSVPGRAVLLPQGATYTLQRQETGRFPVINFHTAAPVTDTFAVLPLIHPDACLALYEQLRQFRQDGRPAAAMAAFYRLLDEIAGASVDRSIPPGSPLHTLLPYMAAHCNDAALTNTALAQRAHISEVYLRRLFLQQLGVTPRQYLLHLRLEKAKRLLEDGRLTVTLVAESCGYTNVYHFCRSFRQYTGLTPTEYRRGRQNLL